MEPSVGGVSSANPHRLLRRKASQSSAHRNKAACDSHLEHRDTLGGRVAALRWAGELVWGVDVVFSTGLALWRIE